jgi:hypothetical protein
MDDTLRIVRYLYDEDDDPSFEQRLADDEPLRQEYEALAETKEALDHRSSASPDEAVVEDLVATAAEAARQEEETGRAASPAADREARSPSRGWSRRLQGASATLAVLLVAGITWVQMGNPLSISPSATPTASDAAPATEPAGGAQEATDRAVQPTDKAVGSIDNAASAGTDVPEWDDREELVQIHRRIERLQSRSTPGSWGGTQHLVQQSQP